MSILKSVLTLMGGNYSAKDYDPKYNSHEAAVAYYKREDAEGQSYGLQSSLTTRGKEDKSPDMIPVSFDLSQYSSLQDKFDHFIPPLVHTALSGSSFHGLSSVDGEKSEQQVISTLAVGTHPNAGGPQARSLTEIIEGPRGVLQLRMSERGLSKNMARKRMELAAYVANAFESALDTEPAHTRREEIKATRERLNTVEGATEFLEGLNERWKDAIAAHSPETTLHVKRVTEVTSLIAKGINEAQDGPMGAITIDKDHLKLLELSAALHDFGKLYTPITILESGIPVPGSRHELGGYDRTLMERHAQDVYDILDIPGFELIGKVRDIAGAHHLHASGKGGYPEAIRLTLMEKKGIPFEAKVLMVADIFEALTAQREYRGGNGLPLSTALDIMNFDVKRGGIDPQVFRFCIEHGIFDAYAKKYAHKNDGSAPTVEHTHEEIHDFDAIPAHDLHIIKEKYCVETGVSMKALNDYIEKEPAEAKDKLVAFANETQALVENADEHAPRSHGHIKPYDSELLEKLALSAEHLKAAQTLKERFCAETGLTMQGLDSFLRMPFDAAEKKAKEIQHQRELIDASKEYISRESGVSVKVVEELMAANPEELKDKIRSAGIQEDDAAFASDFAELMAKRKKLDKRDEDFPSPEFAPLIYDMKMELKKALNPDGAPLYADRNFNPRTQLPIVKTPYQDAFKMKADDAYIHKIFSVNAKDAAQLDTLKNDLIKKVMDADGNDPSVKQAFEDMIKWHVLQTSGLGMGVINHDAQDTWKDNSAKLIDALTVIEADKLAATKKRILDAIPANPLGSSENLTLFSPRRHVEREPAETHR